MKKKLSLSQLVHQKPGLFTAAFLPTVLSTAAGLKMAPSLWLYFLFSLGGAYLVTVSLLRALISGAIEDHWGRMEKAWHPIRFWIQIWVWIALLVCSAAFPVAASLVLRHP